jgi:hypothetical protein
LSALLSLLILIAFVFVAQVFWRRCEKFGIRRLSLTFWAIVGAGLLALAFIQAVI